MNNFNEIYYTVLNSIDFFDHFYTFKLVFFTVRVPARSDTYSEGTFSLHFNYYFTW